MGGNTMKHTVSLKLNHEFRRLYNKGKSAVSPYFVIYCRKTGRAESRLGITTGVKLGKAVKRNFVRRRIRELYRTNESKFVPGYDIVVVARTRAIVGRYADLERSFLQQMKKLGILTSGEQQA
jgi:ribonuclease P protein component